MGSFLGDGDVMCGFEFFKGVSSVDNCAASFADMARVSAMTGTCLAETPDGILVRASRSRSNCVHNKLDVYIKIYTSKTIYNLQKMLFSFL